MMKLGKKLLSTLLAIAMVFGMFAVPAGATEAQETKAQVLHALGLFKGYDNTGTNFGLNDGVTREQALVFLIRLLGEEKAALSWTGNAPYLDVPTSNWVAPYIGYAKDKGYTKGVGKNNFGLGLGADINQMATFALRGLGYSDSAGDFTYAQSPEFAMSLGIVDSLATGAIYTRGDAVDILDGAVAATVKGKTYTLLEKLVESGAVTQDQVKAAAAIAGGGTQKSNIPSGTYVLTCMGNNLRITSDKLVLQNTEPAQIFTIVTKDGYSYIQNSAGRYVYAASLTAGTQLALGSTPYSWLIQKQSGNVYSIRPTEKPELLVCSGEASSKNGTGMLLWPNSSEVKHGQITFTPRVAVTGVALDQTTASVAIGKTLQLTGTLSPSNATNRNVTWSSSASTVAKVDTNGLVTGVKTGTATITVKTADGSKTATCKVTVSNTTVAVTGVKLDQTTASVAVGKTVQLTGTVSPSNATNQSVTWSSGDSTIAKVDSSGVVTGVKAGTATITVKTADGGKTATCKVTVTAGDTYTDKTVYLYNSTNQPATDIRISSAKNSDWGKNLTTGSVAPGASVGILVPVSSSDYTYDIAIIYQDKSTATFSGFNFKNFTSGGSLYAYLENGTPMLSTTKPAAPEDTSAASKALDDRYNKAKDRYSKQLDQLTALGAEKDPAAVEELNAITKEFNDLVKFLDGGPYTPGELKSYGEILDILDGAMNELDSIITQIKDTQKPPAVTRKTVTVTFVNNTDVKFKALFNGGPDNLIDGLPIGGSVSLEFAMPSNDCTFNLLFVADDNTNPQYEGKIDLRSAENGGSYTVTLSGTKGNISW